MKRTVSMSPCSRSVVEHFYARFTLARFTHERFIRMHRLNKCT